MTTDQAAAVFDDLRPYLHGVAYRLTSSWADAEDVVADAWPRWSANASSGRGPASVADSGRGPARSRSPPLGAGPPRDVRRAVAARTVASPPPAAARRRPGPAGRTGRGRVRTPRVPGRARPVDAGAAGRRRAARRARPRLRRGRRRARLLRRGGPAARLARAATHRRRRPTASRRAAAQLERPGRADRRAAGRRRRRLARVLAPDVVFTSDGAGQVSAAGRPLVGVDAVVEVPARSRVDRRPPRCGVRVRAGPWRTATRRRSPGSTAHARATRASRSTRTW